MKKELTKKELSIDFLIWKLQQLRMQSNNIPILCPNYYDWKEEMKTLQLDIATCPLSLIYTICEDVIPFLQEVLEDRQNLVVIDLHTKILQVRDINWLKTLICACQEITKKKEVNNELNTRNQ